MKHWQSKKPVFKNSVLGDQCRIGWTQKNLMWFCDVSFLAQFNAAIDSGTKKAFKILWWAPDGKIKVSWSNLPRVSRSLLWRVCKGLDRICLAIWQYKQPVIWTWMKLSEWWCRRLRNNCWGGMLKILESICWISNHSFPSKILKSLWRLLSLAYFHNVNKQVNHEINNEA